MFDALIKIGGSLYQSPEVLRASLRAWAKLARRHRLLALPGGGPFANQVRAADAAFGLGDSSAHWMAILAMEQYAHLLADQQPEATLAESLEEAAAACAAGRLALLAPYMLLRRADPLPHSWEVTSDSLAGWLAGHARIPLLVLLKSVPGLFAQNVEPLSAEDNTQPLGNIAYSAHDASPSLRAAVDGAASSINSPLPLAQVSRSALASYNEVDLYFARALPTGIDCWLVDGRRPELLAELLDQRATLGTRIVE